jgi:DNA polymerase-3 subunit epsilon
VNDCLAAIELLAAPLPVSAGTGLSKLLENARKATWQIWAENSPFDLKDLLKARGYSLSRSGRITGQNAFMTPCPPTNFRF